MWKSFFKFYSNKAIVPPNLDKRIQELEKIRRKTPHRIALRICKVFVRYGILSKTVTSERYVLRGKENKHIKLTTTVMTQIYDVLKKLGIRWDIRGETLHDLSKNHNLHDDEKASIIKSLLRSNEKKGFDDPIKDSFDYKDIRDDFLGVLSDRYTPSISKSYINENGIQRFKEAHKHSLWGYMQALSKIQSGKKRNIGFGISSLK